MGAVTTNSLFIDVASSAAPAFPKVRLDFAAAEVRAPIAWRCLIGRCLLHLPRIAWMILDVLLLCSGLAMGNRLFVWWIDFANPLADYNMWLASVILASSVILAGAMFGFYEPSTLWARSRIIARCLLTVSFAMLATWLVLHLFMYSSLSRRAAASGIVFFMISASMIRLLAHRAVRDVRRGLLVIGQGPLTGSIIRSVRRGSVPGYRLVGLVVPDHGGNSEQGVSDIPVVGEISDIRDLCRRFQVAEVVVAEAAARDSKYQKAALACLRLGCRVTDETTFYETAYGEVPVSHITPNWFLAADLKGQRQEHAVVKRLFDFVAAGLALVVSTPIMLLIAALVWLDGRGSAFYSQTRVGQGGRLFTLYKFRTMCGNAEANGSTWATPNDPRVTLVGRFFRKSRLDELPQLWNILKGDMSLVGPRPERPEFVGPLAALIPFYDERHLIKPGLTGWAQINYPYGSSIADARRKLQLDLYYVKHTSLELDLIILLRTLGTFFLGSR
jgi:exopolysaccharide biosynthesis polyprenyl glycosylphosphotransferase